jgi:mono/diheme cytochrome c family protein
LTTSRPAATLDPAVVQAKSFCSLALSLLFQGRFDVRRIAFLVVGSLAFASAASAQATRPTSNRPAAELYVQNCQMCHMPDGNAAIKQMNFADGEWIHGTTIKEQVKVVTDGVTGTAMMPFKDRLSDQEILALVKLVRAFDKKLAAKPAAKAKPAPKAGTS